MPLHRWICISLFILTVQALHAQGSSLPSTLITPRYEPIPSEKGAPAEIESVNSFEVESQGVTEHQSWVRVSVNLVGQSISNCRAADLVARLFVVDAYITRIALWAVQDQDRPNVPLEQPCFAPSFAKYHLPLEFTNPADSPRPVEKEFVLPTHSLSGDLSDVHIHATLDETGWHVRAEGLSQSAIPLLR